ncbi:MAG: hypothetical protein RLZZ454_1234 [Pseudomonadota bacterium]|jgi:hypothetical protein
MFFANSSLFYSQIAPILLKSLWLTQGSVETRFGPHHYSLKDCTHYVVT